MSKGIYKVIRPYVNRSYRLVSGGDIVRFDHGSKLAIALVKEGFIKALEPAHQDWSRHAIKSRLTNLLIAPEDYVAASGERHFTYEAALGIEGHRDDGWRLPTRSEWVLICEEFGQKGGTLDTQTLMDNLKLGLNGGDWHDGDGVCYAGAYGFYWSSTPFSNSTNAYNLTFNGTSAVNPSSSDSRYFGFSVRLVKEAK